MMPRRSGRGTNDRTLRRDSTTLAGGRPISAQKPGEVTTRSCCSSISIDAPWQRSSVSESIRACQSAACSARLTSLMSVIVTRLARTPSKLM